MNYASLKLELAKPTYATMSDADAAATINSLTETAVGMRFGSFRTLAALLTAEEYAAVKAALTAAAEGNVVLADMMDLMKLPGDEGGNGGGIDFGAAGVRAMVGQIGAAGGVLATAAAKMLAYAEVQQSWAVNHLGEPAGDGHVASARAEMQGG